MGMLHILKDERYPFAASECFQMFNQLWGVKHPKIIDQWYRYAGYFAIGFHPVAKYRFYDRKIV